MAFYLCLLHILSDCEHSISLCSGTSATAKNTINYNSSWYLRCCHFIYIVFILFYYKKRVSEWVRAGDWVQWLYLYERLGRCVMAVCVWESIFRYCICEQFQVRFGDLFCETDARWAIRAECMHCIIIICSLCIRFYYYYCYSIHSFTT